MSRRAKGVAVLEEVLEHVPAERVLRDPAVTAGLSADQAVWAPVGVPLAVVRASSAEEVRAVVAACYRHGVPVVPRGAGTGLSGGSSATDGCIVVALDRMDAVVEINAAALDPRGILNPGKVFDPVGQSTE